MQWRMVFVIFSIEFDLLIMASRTKSLTLFYYGHASHVNVLQGKMAMGLKLSCSISLSISTWPSHCTLLLLAPSRRHLPQSTRPSGKNHGGKMPVKADVVGVIGQVWGGGFTVPRIKASFQEAGQRRCSTLRTG